CGARFSAGEGEDAGHVDEQHRHVEQVVGPVAPAGQKAVRLAELPPRPEIDAAFSGIPARQRQDRHGFRNEEGDKRQPPQPERCPAVDRYRRHVVDVHDGDDLQEHEVPPAEGPRHLNGGWADHGLQSAAIYRSNAIWPPTSVRSTVMSGSASGGTANGSPDSTARSAHFPTSMLPRLRSSPLATAPPIV